MGTQNTLRPHLERWATHRIRRREALAATCRDELAHLLPLAALHGARPLSALGPWLVDRWMQSTDHLARSTVANRIRTARRFFAWLSLDTGCPDPTIGLKAPRLPERPPRALNAPEAAALYDAADDPRTVAALSLMFQLALRRSEVVGLTFEAWDRYDRTMRIVGKGGKVRVVPVTDALEADLLAYIAHHPAHSGPLLRSYTRGGALSARYLSAVFSRVAYRAGVKRHAWDGVGTHSGRHTAATDVVGSGVPIQVAAEFLGHAKLDTTMLYTGRVRAERVRSAIEGRQYRQPAA